MGEGLTLVETFSRFRDRSGRSSEGEPVSNMLRSALDSRFDVEAGGYRLSLRHSLRDETWGFDGERKRLTHQGLDAELRRIWSGSSWLRCSVGFSSYRSSEIDSREIKPGIELFHRIRNPLFLDSILLWPRLGLELERGEREHRRFRRDVVSGWLRIDLDFFGNFIHRSEFSIQFKDGDRDRIISYALITQLRASF